MSQQVHTVMFGKAHLRYLLHLPAEYPRDKSRRWPVILYLHGSEERGSDIELVKQNGIARIAEEQPDLPFIAVSPQCPAGTMWSFELDKLGILLDEVAATLRVDKSRFYLSGINMGGYGTWNLAVAQPERFAALVPICGGGDPDTVCAIKDVPVWAFHGAQDNVVLVRESRKMVDALRLCGGKVRYTIYPNAGHDAWTRAYNDPRLFEWLLSHARP